MLYFFYKFVLIPLRATTSTFQALSIRVKPSTNFNFLEMRLFLLGLCIIGLTRAEAQAVSDSPPAAYPAAASPAYQVKLFVANKITYSNQELTICVSVYF